MVNPPGDGVAGVPGAPVFLRFLTAGCLAIRFATGPSPVSHSRVRPEPSAANPARSLPGLWHRDDLSFITPSAAVGTEVRSECPGHFWRAGLGNFS